MDSLRKFNHWMSNHDEDIVRSAIEAIRNDFPFPEILEETEDTITAIALGLSKLVSVPGKILDLGCGALDKVLVYQQMGYECYAVDDFQDAWHQDENNLNPVLTLAQARGINVHYQESPWEVPWERGTFDVVTIVNVIEHLHESPRYVLNFAGEYLKPGGLLIVVMPNSANLRKRISVLFGNSNYTPVRGLYEFEGLWRGHTREYTLNETKQIIDWTGFQIIMSDTFHGLLTSRLRKKVVRILFRFLCILVPRYRDSLVVVARKPDDWEPREADAGTLKGIPGHGGFA